MKDKFLSVALSQVGYIEKESNKDLDSKTANAGDKNYTKYGAWYGLNPSAWCAMFVSWCANEVGILKDLIPKYSGCGTGYKWFQERGLLTKKPKSGDIGFLKPTRKGAISSHTFIVYDVFGDTITTIEGNINNRVLGFGSVQYPIIKYVDNVDYEGLNVRYLKDGSKTGELLQQATKVRIIKIDGKKAIVSNTTYVDNSYLVDKEPPYKVVTGADKEGLNVRKIILGIVSKKVITTLKNGTKVKVYKTKNGWSKVSPNSNAWCYSEYLK